MDGFGPIKIGGIEVPAEERTPLVDRLLRAIEELRADNRQLRDEIDRLICYQRLRYLLPDGTGRTAPLPAHVQGHFGPGLRSYVLYQHHQNGVTQPPPPPAARRSSRRTPKLLLFGNALEGAFGRPVAVRVSPGFDRGRIVT
jgi:hypothetical protein